jgi:hypothetical protein
LEITGWVAIILGLFIILWAASLWLAKDPRSQPRLNWESVLLSLFGVVWIGFGADFILRFLLLAYDPDYFQITNFPLTMLPPEVLSEIFTYLALFWIFFCLGFLCLAVWMTRKPPRILAVMEQLVSLRMTPLLDVVAIVTTFLTIIPYFGTVPNALLVPLGRTASLCAVPALIAWILYFRGEQIGARRFIYLIPLALTYLLSPYRTHLITLILCILIPALQFRKKLSFSKVLIGFVIFFIVSTYLNNLYRAYLWGESARDSVHQTFSEDWETWKRNPGKSPWVLAANRFHGFDSMALTVYAVPEIIPYSDRNILYEFMLISFVPRLFMDVKPLQARGREFSTTIWALGLAGVAKRESAPIAPSLPGDLYSIHGVPILILGAFIFGLLIGLLENWLRGSTATVKCIILPIFWVGIAENVEQDFILGLGTIIQYLIVFFIALAILKHFMAPATKQKRVLSRPV